MVFDPANPGGLGPVENPMPNLIILHDPQDIINACKNNRTIILAGDIFHPALGRQKHSISCLGLSEYNSKFKLYTTEQVIPFPSFIYDNEVCNYFIHYVEL